mmetsp:Transcript_9046/g.22133  ORF Transcript_9046/g.22133 Transcript_9046/m.22133 type:complete len:202 (-) Transcript_9046:2146-2751(-)
MVSPTTGFFRTSVGKLRRSGPLVQGRDPQQREEDHRGRHEGGHQSGQRPPADREQSVVCPRAARRSRRAACPALLSRPRRLRQAKNAEGPQATAGNRSEAGADAEAQHTGAIPNGPAWRGRPGEDLPSSALASKTDRDRDFRARACPRDHGRGLYFVDHHLSRRCCAFGRRRWLCRDRTACPSRKRPRFRRHCQVTLQRSC